MALVRIDFEDLDDDALPDMCIKCGAPASVRMERTFAWSPPWIRTLIVVGLFVHIALIVGLILALVLTKRRRIVVPLCEQHQGHWSKRTLAALIAFGVVLLPLVGGFLTLFLYPSNSNLTIGLFLGAFLAFVIWLIVMLIVQSGAIGAVEITDRDITLRKVGVDFARAYDEDRRGRRSPQDRRQLDRWDRGASQPRNRDEPNIRRAGPPGDAIERG
jgi:hypothetical protein